MPDHTTVQYGFNLVFIALAGFAVLRAIYGCHHSVTVDRFKTFLLLFVYYGLYLLVPFFSWVLWQWSIGRQNAWEAVPLLLLSLFLLYARFIEPVVLTVRHTPVTLNQEVALRQPLKVALLADLHVGLFSGRTRQLKKIVDLVNAEHPDFIVFSGDWTYEPNDHLKRDLNVLSGFIAPAYSVPGNHDEQIPGPPVQHLLSEALQAANITCIEGKIVELEEVRLIGSGDLWAGKADMQVMLELPQDKPWIVVAHNPDTVAQVPPLPGRPLMLSGHTHGGQLELPWLTNYVLKRTSLLGFKKGLYQTENAQVYVTVGTGLVGVPLRFRAPPTIDILHIH
ncbi:metallophosphoesterase [Alkanindiges sp. WGS2144]|uniref:metallophosphoesterase n=1 Tax=Alkanindiges sp. WGS2144 TaxID=3366808 RepID=UPI003751CD29